MLRKRYGDTKTELVLPADCERYYYMCDPMDIYECIDDDTITYSVEGIFEAEGLTEDELIKAIRTDMEASICQCIVDEAESDKIVSLYDIAKSLGINHMKTQRVMQIVKRMEIELPNYHPVRMMKTENDSLFVSLCFVQNDVEFDEGMDNSNLKIIRESQELSQSQLAKLSGVSVRTIQAFEQGARDLSEARFDIVHSLAIALGVSVDDLICKEHFTQCSIESKELFTKITNYYK